MSRPLLPPALPALLVLLALLALLSLLAPVAAQEQRIGELSTLAHSVAGTVVLVDAHTLRIDDFFYDGTGPRAVFWFDEGTSATPGGLSAFERDSGTCGVPDKLPAASGESVVIEPPDGRPVSEFGYLSVYCIDFDQDFGSVELKIDGNVPEGEAVCGREGGEGSDAGGGGNDGGEDAGGEAEPFPVKDGWNCEELSDEFQVRWVVEGESLQVELVGRTPVDRYMGFGVSGEDARTAMVGSDVVIAAQDGDEFRAVDFHMSSRAPCSEGVGVCPDEEHAPTAGTNDVSDVSGEREGDLMMVAYTRPLEATDELDKPISTSDATFITWAVGPYDAESGQPAKHAGPLSLPSGDVSISFGRDVESTCANMLTVMDVEEEAVPGFLRPTISDTTEITARIGPSGGARGYGGITGGTAWGIAWYMSPTGSTGKDVLIPAIGVERGKTYVFSVQGGVDTGDDGNGAPFHPLYITDSAEGGYKTKQPADRAKEKVYAGVEELEKDSDGGVVTFRATATGALCEIASSISDEDALAMATWEDYFDTLDLSCAENESVTSNSGTLEWTVPEDAPDVLYYQCVTHRFLGFKIVVFDEGAVDETKLRQENGGGDLTDAGEGDSDQSDQSDECRVTFKGTERTYSGCRKGLSGDVEVYWTLRENEDEIDTLFRAPTDGGYVSFGWGYSDMVGSNAAVAYANADGEAVIDDYFLEAKSPEGVQPAGNQKLTKTDASVDGAFVAGVFTRKLTMDNLPPISDGEVQAIWAVGPRASSATALSQHGVRGFGPVDLSQKTGNVEEGSRLNSFFSAHAALMLISWAFLTPAAVAAMTHLKGYNPKTFQTHRALNALSVLLVAVAYIMALARGSRSEKAHLGIGTVAVVLALTQVASGLLRPHTGAAARRPWYLAHALVGATALVLGLVNALVGMAVFDAGAGWFVGWGIGVGLFVLANLVLFALRSRLKKAEKGSEAVPLADGEGQGAEDVFTA